MVTPIKCFIFLLLTSVACSSYGNESGSDAIWSKRIQLEQTASFSYQEVRILEMLDSPWEAGGLLIASTDGTLVKLQMRPERIIMAITIDEMIYFNSATNEKHRLALSTPHPMVQQALIFKDLLQGREDRINTQFAVDYQHNADEWSLVFSPKPAVTNMSYQQILMQGTNADHKRHILLKEASGDSTTLILQLLESGEQLEFMIERLLREANG